MIIFARSFVVVIAMTLLIWATAFAQHNIRFGRITIEEGLSESVVSSILQDQRGFMWFGTQDGLNRFDGRNFRVYRRDAADTNSLSDNLIHTLMEDRAGSMWVGTNFGLNRYNRLTDGFDRFTCQTGKVRLADNVIRSVYEAGDGRFYLITAGEGLTVFDPKAGTFRHHYHDPGDSKSLSDDRVRVIFEDRDGDLWIGTRGGLNRVVRQPGPGKSEVSFERFVTVPGVRNSLVNDDVQFIYQESKGPLWIATLDGGLSRFDKATGRFDNFVRVPGDPGSLSHNYVSAILETADGSFWLATNGGGLNRFNSQTGKFKRYRADPSDSEALASDEIFSNSSLYSSYNNPAYNLLMEDRFGRMWIASPDAGISQYDPAKDTFMSYRKDVADRGSLVSDLITCVYEDRAGSIWIGTGGDGLSFLCRERNNFIHYSSNPYDPSTLSDPNIWGVIEDRSGNLWVGTDNGMNILRAGSNRFEHIFHQPGRPGGLSGNTVFALREDKFGLVWISTNNGLDRYDPATGRYRHYVNDPDDPNSLSDSNVWIMYEDSSGEFWIATNAGGLNRYVRNKDEFVSYKNDPNDPKSISHNRVDAIMEGDAGTIWVGTEGGLNRLDVSTGTFDRFVHDPNQLTSLSSNNVMAVQRDRKGRIWIGTFGGGLNLFNPEDQNFTSYTEKDGLRNDVVYAVLEDESGALWLSHNKGISRLDPDVLSIRSYDVDDGLQSNEFNSGAYFKAPDGRMFFGGINGLNVFHPDSIVMNNYRPPVLITAFRRFNEEIALDTVISEKKHLVLNYDENVISFEFIALDYKLPYKNRYAHQLEGFDPDWISSGFKNDVTYTNLDPGDYVFRVKGSNNDGLWNEAGVSIRITVIPPFWQRWWFRGLIALFLAAAVFGVISLRTAAINKTNQRLKEAVNQRTAELQAVQEEMVRKERFSTLGHLTAVVSHELRNPLGTIQSSIHSIDERLPEKEPAIDRAIQRIRRSVARCDRIVTDLLDYLRTKTLNLEPTALDPWLSEVVREQVMPGGFKLVEDLATGSNVLLDRDRFRRCVVNIIQNAVQAIEESSPAREGSTIWVSTRSGNGNVEVLISDNGPGIPEEALLKIFEPLYSTKQNGVGLGLSIVKEIVEQHDGGIDVLSTVGKGTTFRLWLPHTH